MHRIPLDDEDCFTFSEVDAMHKQAVWEIMWAFVLLEDDETSPCRLMIESHFDEAIGVNLGKRGREGEAEDEEAKRTMLALTSGGGGLPPEIVREGGVLTRQPSAGEMLGRLPYEIFERIIPGNVSMALALVNVNSLRNTVNNVYGAMRRDTTVPAYIRNALRTPHGYVTLADRESPDSDIDAAKTSVTAVRRLFILHIDLWKVGFGRLPYEEKVAILKLQNKKLTLNMVNMLRAEAGTENFNFFNLMWRKDAWKLIYRDVKFFQVTPYVFYKFGLDGSRKAVGKVYRVLVFKNTPEDKFLGIFGDKVMTLEKYEEYFDDHEYSDHRDPKHTGVIEKVEVRIVNVFYFPNFPEGVRTMFQKNNNLREIAMYTNGD